MSPFTDSKIGETRSCNHPIDPSSPYEKGNICDKCLNIAWDKQDETATNDKKERAGKKEFEKKHPGLKEDMMLDEAIASADLANDKIEPPLVFPKLTKKEKAEIQEEWDILDSIIYEILNLKKITSNLMSRFTGQPLERILEDSERDFYMDPDAALKYGLVDHIAKPPIKEVGTEHKPAAPSLITGSI